jgi:5-formyltetrahydrofolate cyclo-ligase
MEKQALRETVWDALQETGERRFPFPPHGRIPNFNGADAAAERLAETQAWRDADVLKCNPDAPQLPVRRAALRAGKTVYMAVPRLRDERCFLRLAPDEVPDIDAATTVSGSAKHGVPVHPEEVPHVDLVVAGSVAVSEAGDRVGKGEGYSDLEWGVLSAFDAVDDETAVATTVHELQVVDGPESPAPPGVVSSGTEGGSASDGAGRIEGDAHDVPLDVVCTPSRTIRCERRERPVGVDWAALSEARIAEMPVLERLRPE